MPKKYGSVVEDPDSNLAVWKEIPEGYVEVPSRPGWWVPSEALERRQAAAAEAKSFEQKAKREERVRKNIWKGLKGALGIAEAAPADKPSLNEKQKKEAQYQKLDSLFLKDPDAFSPQQFEHYRRLEKELGKSE